MSTAHFNIGSNSGDRLALIGRAVALLEEKTGANARVSAPVFSAPWGYESEHEFANVGVCIETNLTASSLLGLALEIERQIDPEGCHRTPSGGYADRKIDIDLICVDSEICDSEPALPHPRMHLREFVLSPMKELMPEWRHPLLGLTPAELLVNLHNKIT